MTNMTKCERVLSLAPDMGLRAYEQELYETFVQIILSEAEAEDLLSILLWEDCNDGFYILSSTGVNVDNLTLECIAFLSFVARHVVHHKKALVLPGGSSMCLRAMSRAGFSSVAVFPLTYRLHIAGCFVLARQGGPSPFQFTDLAQATLFGNILSDIFERLRLIEVVKSQHKARRQAKREHERLHSLTASSLYIVPDTLDTIMEKEASVS